jgi:hypothetical protein
LLYKQDVQMSMITYLQVKATNIQVSLLEIFMLEFRLKNIAFLSEKVLISYY